MSDGHSGTPLHAKLGMTEGMRVGLDEPPPEFVGLTLMPVPTGVTLHTRIAGNMDVVLGFYDQRRRFGQRLPVLRRRIEDDGVIWIAWPTKASRMPTDMSEDAILEVASANGLVGTEMCALDHVWSGLKLVVGEETDATT